MEDLIGMKTLYLSDLDGTLLRSDETISDHTREVIERLTESGMIFSYATARSFLTARKVTKGLRAKIPLIVYNGAFVVDNVTGGILYGNYFDDSVQEVLCELFRNEIYPIVYSFAGHTEKFCYIREKCTEGMKRFLDSRKGDVRNTPVADTGELIQGNCFYITCIDEPDKLYPMYERFREQFHCVYERDIYSREQWLEIMPGTVSKAGAAARLKELTGCGRMVVFGDGENDIELFRMADECYAMANAADELKKIATAVIEGNDEDGVAKWLARHFAD